MDQGIPEFRVIAWQVISDGTVEWIVEIATTTEPQSVIDDDAFELSALCLVDLAVYAKTTIFVEPPGMFGTLAQLRGCSHHLQIYGTHSVRGAHAMK